MANENRPSIVKYSNQVAIGLSSNDVYLDFMINLGDDEPDTTRIYLSHQSAKKLLKTLENSIAQFEKLHGEINIVRKNK